MSNFFQLRFQDRRSIFIRSIIEFNDHLIFIALLILSFILYILIVILYYNYINLVFFENHNLEFIWTLIPLFILIFIAFPSIKILYIIEENDYCITLKVIGHQWYWSYEYPNFNIFFNSYIDRSLTILRLLDVDNRVILPILRKIHLIIRSDDVIHSWAVPSLGLKIDAIPGRLNNINIFSKRRGLYFGQCSEICGANHSFIPIVLEMLNYKIFYKWIH